MRVLAIDTALAVCAAAVLDTTRPGMRARESLPMLRGHAEALMPMIARVMHAAELSFADLDRIAVPLAHKHIRLQVLDDVVMRGGEYKPRPVVRGELADIAGCHFRGEPVERGAEIISNHEPRGGT